MPIATGHEQEELEAELEVIFLFLIFVCFSLFFLFFVVCDFDLFG